MAEYGKVYRKLNFSKIKKHALVRKAIFERDAFSCQICGIKAKKIPENYDGHRAIPYRRNARYLSCFDYLEIDHVVPLSRGGNNDISNLQTLCDTCNGKKGAKACVDL